jgi:hypothetical protein
VVISSKKKNSAFWDQAIAEAEEKITATRQFIANP